MKAKNKLFNSLFALPIIGYFASSVAIAEGSPVAPKTTENRASLYHQLDELRSQNAILTEQLKNAELRNKINESNKPTRTTVNSNLSVPSLTGQSTTAFNSPVGAESNTQNSNTTKTPPFPYQVHMISGSLNNLTALISLPNGSQINVAVGTEIPNFGSVKTISPNSVQVTNKSQQVIDLPFASEMPATFSSAPLYR